MFPPIIVWLLDTLGEAINVLSVLLVAYLLFGIKRSGAEGEDGTEENAPHDQHAINHEARTSLMYGCIIFVIAMVTSEWLIFLISALYVAHAVFVAGHSSPYNAHKRKDEEE